mgnify:CR=1 FL=1
MPSGPGTYGRKRGRPRKRKGKKSTDIMYEMIGESIWDTYRNMASILAEAGFGGAPEVKGLKRVGPRALLAKGARKLGPEGRREWGLERTEKARKRRASQVAKAEDEMSAAQDI